MIYDGDVGAIVASAAAPGEEGLGLAVIALRPPLDPAVLEPLASALSEIG